MTTPYPRYEEDQKRWAVQDQVIDKINKLLSGLNKVLIDENIPEADRKLFGKYLREAIQNGD